MSYRLVRGKPNLKSYKRNSVNKALNNEYARYNSYGTTRGSYNHYTIAGEVYNGTYAHGVYHNQNEGDYTNYNRKFGYR